MHILAVARGLGVALVGGTLVGFVPEKESPLATAELTVPVQSPPRASAGPAVADGGLWEWAQDFDDDLPAVRFEFPLHSRPSAEPPIILAAAQNVEAVKAKKSQDHVHVKVFLSVDKLPAGGRCKFAVILDVDEGWHVYANPAGNEDLIPTTVTVLSKQKLKQGNTKYPKGSSLVVEEFDEPVSIYQGEVAIKGEIQAPENAGGKTDELDFQIEFQVCNDVTCIRKVLTLSDKLAIVRPGTPVKQINQKYFTGK